ncbi:MAG TPA: GLUG motif-containing protein [Rhizomicrobium sp.]|nr:GLUG motif-containing protein [Rhizomicrobium sp.]
MSCSGSVCSPTAVNAVLNVQDLEALLASGNATVTTTGSGVQATDIIIRARLEWSAVTTLALDAYRSVELHAKLTLDGAGGLSLVTNAGGRGGEFSCSDTGRVEFRNLSGLLSINGTPYLLVNSVASLAGAIAGNPSGAFALADSYDAAKDGTYASPPIPTAFSGSFSGLGNTVSNLSINDPAENAYVGLFAETTGSASIDNIRLANENVQGGSGTSVDSSTEFIGGLAGYGSGTIAHSFSSGTVTGGQYAAVGGLIGASGAATVSSSGSAAAVSNATMGMAPVGGLLGITNSGSITDSYATGNVTGSGFLGGLVGFNARPNITHSWASGQVSGTDNTTTVGGLVGANQYGVIERSHASGAVSCQQVCGGLLGWAGTGAGGTPKISASYSMGSVTADIAGNTLAGGLVGYNELGEVLNSYASGAVSAGYAGGLVGQNDNSVAHSISRSYATGTVSGSSGGSGGFVGFDRTSTITRSYWDMTTSGINNPSQGAGNVANDPGIKGLTDSRLKSGLPGGFSPKVWRENANINGGLPFLIANPPRS